MKKNTPKYFLLSFAGLISASLVWFHLNKEKQPFIFMEGKALGVFYSLSYQGDARLEKSLDSMINRFDLALN